MEIHKQLKNKNQQMKVDVKTELKQKRDASVEQTHVEAGMKEVKLLLEGAEREEREILRAAGLDHNIKQIEDKLGIDLERKRFEERVKDTVFTEEEVKDFCFKYNLKFLISKRYKGNVDPILGAKILRFFKENKIDGTSWEAAQNLYIMARAKAFNLDERPIIEENLDPAIFYRLKDTHGTGYYYTMIHKWGNDFSVARRISGVVNRSKTTWAVTVLTLLFVAITALSMSVGLHPFHKAGHWWGFPIYAAISFITFAIIWGKYFLSDDDLTSRVRQMKAKFELRFSESGWNSSEK